MGSGAISYEVAPPETKFEVEPPSATPPEQPGYFKRLGQSLGLPTSREELESMKPSTAEMVGGPAVTAGKALYGYGKRAAQGIYEGGKEAYEAGRNIGEGQPILPNVGKAASGIMHANLQATPIIGPAIETAGQDVTAGNYSGAAGGLTGVIGQVAAPDLIEHGGEIAKPVGRAIRATAAGAKEAALSTPIVGKPLRAFAEGAANSWNGPEPVTAAPPPIQWAKVPAARRVPIPRVQWPAEAPAAAPNPVPPINWPEETPIQAPQAPIPAVRWPGGRAPKGTPIARGQDVTFVPEPRPEFEGEEPNYMASVPRSKLGGMAISRKPGAATQLQQLGKPIIYVPNEAEYPGPRPKKP